MTEPTDTETTVRALLNAAGMNASTTGPLARAALSVTGWKSWFVRVKSGAFVPTSTAIRPPTARVPPPWRHHGSRPRI